MRNSLIFKLMGAFLFVIAIGALVIAVLTSQATKNAFNLYTTRNGQVWAQRLAPDLADYYAQSLSWQGVDALLQSELNTQPLTGMMGNGMGAGQGRQRTNAALTPVPASGVGLAGMGQRLILLDEKGIVISDTQNELVGRQVSATELKYGAAITVNNNLVGTLIVTPNDLSNSNSPAGQFLASVNQAIFSSVGIAVVIAMIIGGILFLQITSPLRKLKNAAAAIASGDLNQRVSIHSKDEFGELGKTFNSMAESLASAEIQRQHLIADIAHELRTPLAAIQGTLEGIQDGVLPLDDEQVAALHAETALLTRLVGDLRLLSLAEAGQLKLELQETTPSELFQQITERAKVQTQQKNIQLKTDIQANLPNLWIDSDRITQVLNNLISNALRYTPKGGLISVQASVQPGGNSIVVFVTDTGPGIDPGNLPYVFDRFYRVDKSRTRASGGSGLGLAIVKQLVEAHGGKVQAESPVFQNEDQQRYGTKISFTLPISSPKAES
jgi:two-component system, OmpR family, sensor histidine kinase BaeS